MRAIQTFWDLLRPKFPIHIQTEQFRSFSDEKKFSSFRFATDNETKLEIDHIQIAKKKHLQTNYFHPGTQTIDIKN